MSDQPTDPPGWICPNCGRVSYHPKDRENRFCAMCGFVDDIVVAPDTPEPPPAQAPSDLPPGAGALPEPDKPRAINGEVPGFVRTQAPPPKP